MRRFVSTAWCGTPPSPLILLSNAVHVWRVDLDQPSSCWRQFEVILSAEERIKADLFRFASLRSRYITCRASLRCILSGYTHQQPEMLTILAGPYGKPFLQQPANDQAVEFNVSHSQQLALIAVTRGRPVGVDVEWIDPQCPIDLLSTHFFSSREVAILQALPPFLRTEAFFTCWTRKEAVLKARGDGLSPPLSACEVTFLPDNAALPQLALNSTDAACWSLRQLDPAPGYTAAIALQCQDWDLSCWHWNIPGGASPVSG